MIRRQRCGSVAGAVDDPAKNLGHRSGAREVFARVASFPVAKTGYLATQKGMIAILTTSGRSAIS
jgi:hypothetical protein